MISHTCQSPAEGQLKPHHLAARHGVDVRVVIPRRWKHYGAWREPTVLPAPAFRPLISRVRWPWAGPAQFYLHHYPDLSGILSDFRPDLIDLWEEPWGLVSAHACYLRNRIVPRTPIISETEQNIDKSLPFPFERLRRYTLRNADFVVGRNRESLDVTRNKGYAGPAEVVPNAVDTTLFRPLDRDACRAELGLSGFVAGYVGRLVEEKGLDDLVDALRFTPPDVSLLFVGSGPLERDLLARAQAAGAAGRVRILPAMPLAELPTVMNALDVFALPSRTTPRWKEQFGRVLIEAHACRRPVIGSDSGAIPDVVGAGGLVVPERDPEALGRAIERLRAEPPLADEFAEQGYQRALAEFTWEAVADRMHSIYQTVLAGRATAGAVA